MKLYGFWSFNPQKIRLALDELGLAHEMVNVDLGKREQRTDAFRALNPVGKIPVLEDDGFVLWESNAILGYLGERERRLWPSDPRGKADALRWLFFETSLLAPRVGSLWFADLVAPLFDIPRDEEDYVQANKELPRWLGIVEQRLAQAPHLLGPDFSLVDCCYGAVLAALSGSEFDLGPYPAVRDYLARLRARPSWAKCEFRY